jgi:hypothetical protein
MSLEIRLNDILVLDKRTVVGEGARFFVITRSQRSISNRDGTMKIQAFHKPNSKSGLNDN